MANFQHKHFFSSLALTWITFSGSLVLAQEATVKAVRKKTSRL